MVTERHFANFAPFSAYFLNRAGSPSRPLVTFSVVDPSNGSSPWSTLIPGRIPFLASSSGNATLSLFCQNVSSKRMTPDRLFPISGVMNRSSRHFWRISAVLGMLCISNRLSAVGLLSSAARIPFPRTTS